jgi:hypothetical protein
MKTTLLLAMLGLLPVEDIQIAGGCFLTSEQVSGANRICYYDCVSGTQAITIPVNAVCPYSR